MTRDRIVAAALRLIDEQGMTAFSMRRLAGELEVDPMAIYHHLPGKEAVLTAVIADVFGSVRVETAGIESWQGRVRAFADAYRAVVRTHPHLVRYVITHPSAVASAMLDASEDLYAALELAGMPLATIIRSADVIVDYVHGFTMAEAAGPLDQSGGAEELQALLRLRPEHELVVMRRIIGSVSANELRADFGFSLDVILAGLELTAFGKSGQPSTDG